MATGKNATKKRKRGKRNYAATDATLINIRALKKRVGRLEQIWEHVVYDVNTLFEFMNKTERGQKK